MNVREIAARREAIRVEMRAIHDANPDGALPDAAQARWTALESEVTALQAAEHRAALLDEADRRAAGRPLTTGGSDQAYETELRAYNVTRALAGAAGLAVEWGRERELSQEVARRSGRQFQGIAIPIAALSAGPVEQRVFTTGNPAGGPGSNIIATDVMADQTIDRLRASLVVRRLGATVLSNLTGNVSIPRIKADATASWVAENAAISASDPQTDAVSLTPKHVGAITEFSRNLLLQSSPDVEQLIRGMLAQVLAQALDAAAVAGSGSSNQPLGVLGTSGIGSVAMGTNGGAITFDAVQDLIGAVADANAEAGALAFLTNTKVRRAVNKLKDSQNRPLGADTVFAGMPRLFTNNVPATLTKGTSSGVCSALIYGDWSDLLIGLWSEVDVLVNPYESTAYSKGNVQVRAMTTADISVRHAASFAAIQDILA
ncbi:MAG: phage major capsid protein [Acetobacteraceae bacterium]